MAYFAVTFRNPAQEVVTKILEFPSKEAAWNAPAGAGGWVVTEVQDSVAPPESIGFGKRRRTGYISGKRLIRLCKTVGAMLRGKMKISNALEIYAKKLEDADLKQILGQVVHKINKEGLPPWRAFADTGRFDPQFIAIVKAADVSSSVGRGLRKIAERIEKQKGFVTELIGQLAFPGLAIIVGTIGFVVLQYGGVKTFDDLMTTMKVDPGMIMGSVFKLGAFTRATWPVFAIGFAGLAVFLAVTPKVREAILSLLMSRIKTLREMVMGMRQLTILSTMDLILNCYGPNAGLQLTHALQAAIDVAEGTNFHDELKRVNDLVSNHGMPLGSALESETSFDPQITQQLGIGAETNSTGDQVNNLCEMYEEMTRDAMARFKFTAYIFSIIYAVIVVFLIAAGVIFPLLILGPRMLNNAGPIGM